MRFLPKSRSVSMLSSAMLVLLACQWPSTWPPPATDAMSDTPPQPTASDAAECVDSCVGTGDGYETATSTPDMPASPDTGKVCIGSLGHEVGVGLSSSSSSVHVDCPPGGSNSDCGCVWLGATTGGVKVELDDVVGTFGDEWYIESPATIWLTNKCGCSQKQCALRVCVRRKLGVKGPIHTQGTALSFEWQPFGQKWFQAELPLTP